MKDKMDDKKYKDGSYRHASESIYKICKEENLDYEDKIAVIDYMIFRVVRSEIKR